MANDSENPMRQLVIDKVTVNIGVGQAGEALENARTLLNRLTGKKSVITTAKVRNPVWRIKKGDPIGTKVTLRGAGATDFLKKSIAAKGNKLSSGSFDREGNFSLGVAEYIDFPGAKYDPKIGIIGFDVSVTMKRRGGSRISRRRRAASHIGRSHKISRSESIEFAKNALGAQVG
ncbi:50S ribosomal protein L5 [Candidatus Parvarchaeota archaeon]|nr:50S ribosomal protein L5 [Candidatus Parvarchaeota archaeon]